VVLAFAQAGATEVKPQNRKSEAVQRLHGVEDDFVVQRPAIERMRMADQRSVRGVLSACIKQSFQPASRAGEKQRSNGGRRQHRSDYTRRTAGVPAGRSLD